MTKTLTITQIVKSGLMAIALGLVACSSAPTLPKPAELGPNPALLAVRASWISQVGVIDFPLSIPVTGAGVTLAGSDGSIASLDAATGNALWRTNIGAKIVAGVGSDGHYSAVVTQQNELVILEVGRELSRIRLTSQVFTAPLVAGKRVFVLGADRSVSAFDAQSGKKLWSNQRSGEALVLRQAGVLTAVNNTLVAGLGGHLVGLNPENGGVLWDTPLANPRGINDIERMVDLVSGVSRNATVVCARAFQAAVGCINAERGTLLWKHAAQGSAGLHGDDKQVYGVEADGRLLAWRLSDGQVAWSSERLRYRQLSSPLVLGRSVVVGDETGTVHFLSRSDGSTLTRLTTDGSAISVAPVLAGSSLIVATRTGSVFGFVPQ